MIAGRDRHGRRQRDCNGSVECSERRSFAGLTGAASWLTDRSALGLTGFGCSARWAVAIAARATVQPHRILRRRVAAGTEGRAFSRVLSTSSSQAGFLDQKISDPHSVLLQT